MKKIAITLITVFAVILGIVKTLNYQTSIRKHLPAGASDIKEEVYGLVDFTRYMKAKCSEEEFHEFREKLGYSEADLLSRTDRNKYNWNRTQPDPVDSWWSPQRKIEGSYGHYDEYTQFYSITKFEEGYVYFLARQW
jgi:hypothetical protein